MSNNTIFMQPLTVETKNGPIQFYDSKDSSKPPVILLHGAMLDESRLIWHHVAPALAEDFRVIAIDFPRHGGSRPWSGEANQEVLLSGINKVIELLALEKVSFVGLSLGASMASYYAIHRPEKVDRLVLAAPGGLEKRRPWQFSTWLTLKIPGLMRLTTKWLASSPKLVRSSLISNLRHKEKTKDIDALVQIAIEEVNAKETHKERALDDWQSAAYGPLSMKTYLMPELSSIKVPTLLIRGEKDPLVSRKDIEEASRRIENSRLEIIPGAGHLSALDEPELFAQLVSRFLSQ